MSKEKLKYVRREVEQLSREAQQESNGEYVGSDIKGNIEVSGEFIDIAITAFWESSRHADYKAVGDQGFVSVETIDF